MATRAVAILVIAERGPRLVQQEALRVGTGWQAEASSRSLSRLRPPSSTSTSASTLLSQAPFRLSACTFSLHKPRLAPDPHLSLAMPDSPQTTAALAGPSSVSPLSSGAFSPDSPPLASSSSMLPARDGGSGYSPLTDPSDFVGRSKSKKGKGKMREVIAPSSTNNDGWLDLERQDVGGLTSEDDQEMIRDGWERVNELSPTPGATAYPPPLTEEEQEAKRIADVRQLLAPLRSFHPSRLLWLTPFPLPLLPSPPFSFLSSA